jgi:hypothetical protein
MPRPEKADVYDFVMGFVSHSRRYKSQFVDTWTEVLLNFIVEPYDYQSNRSVDRPYVAGQRRSGYYYNGRATPGATTSEIVLKDGETHKAIMSYAAHLVLSMLGDRKGEYVKAHPVGYEDAKGKARTVTKLMRYNFARPGTFRSMVSAVIDMLLFGTSVVKTPWKYKEREMPVREIFTDEDGFEVDEFVRTKVEAYNDVCLKAVDVQDFFPDPGETSICDMVGVAEKMRFNEMQARSMAEDRRWKASAVTRAIHNHQKAESPGGSRKSHHEDEFREGIDQPYDKGPNEQFNPMIAFQYHGDVPWEDEGSSRRRITVLNGEIVEDKPYPLADPNLPYHELTINPMTGRFYGVSPAEIIRFDQDLMDAVKGLSAEAVIRQVHPPIAFDEDSGIDVAHLRRWSPDMPIPIRGGPKSVGTLRYDASVFTGFAQMAETKTSMQETAGANSAFQAQGLGSSRASATQANFQQQQALGRPELAAAVLEKECMPSIAQGMLRRDQQFLTSEDLTLRVGEDPQAVWIGDIMGEFDIQFIGSRMAMTRQEKLQAYDRLASMTAAIPAAQAMVPWQMMLRNLIGDVLELPEVAAQIGNPDDMMRNLIIQMLSGQGQGAGNGNATVPGAEPAGALPGQVTGASG